MAARAAQLMASDRKLSQYKIGRGDTSIRARLSRPVRSNTAPPGGLPTVSERAPLPGRLPGKALNDWRQRLIQVGAPRRALKARRIRNACVQASHAVPTMRFCLTVSTMSAMHVYTADIYVSEGVRSMYYHILCSYAVSTSECVSSGPARAEQAHTEHNPRAGRAGRGHDHGRWRADARHLGRVRMRGPAGGQHQHHAQ